MYICFFNYCFSTYFKIHCMYAHHTLYCFIIWCAMCYSWLFSSMSHNSWIKLWLCLTQITFSYTAVNFEKNNKLLFSMFKLTWVHWIVVFVPLSIVELYGELTSVKFVYKSKKFFVHLLEPLQDDHFSWGLSTFSSKKSPAHSLSCLAISQRTTLLIFGW